MIENKTSSPDKVFSFWFIGWYEQDTTPINVTFISKNENNSNNNNTSYVAFKNFSMHINIP